MTAGKAGKAGMTRRIAAALVLVLTVAGCSSSGSSDSGDADGEPIRFALDWTPNTNHTGLYVAMANGWFDEAGIDVTLLPYSDTSTDTLIDSGAAEFGISFQTSTTVARAAGANVTSVYAPLQHWASAIAVRADHPDITRPRDLDGKTYAGFGGVADGVTLDRVIHDDGGTADYRTVTLGTSAYEAVYSGAADFTISFMAWEGIEAEHLGMPMQYFDFTKYGVPDTYNVVVDGNSDWLAAHPDRARAFVDAISRGYTYAAEHPEEAARILIEQNPGTFPDEQLVIDSQKMLAESYMRDASGRVGPITAEQWSTYGDFLYDAGALSDNSGNPLTERPDWSTFFTNEYLDAA